MKEESFVTKSDLPWRLTEDHVMTLAKNVRPHVLGSSNEIDYVIGIMLLDN